MALAIAILPINFALGTDYPAYKDGLLTIPSVNTTEQAGKYQDITFKLTDQGSWQLLSLRTIGDSSLGLALIEKVEVIKADSFPTQILLRISGGLINGCFSTERMKINQRQESSRFDIAITSISIPPTPAACIPVFLTFVRTIALPVYGLSAGTYSYNVNGITGTFELTADNKYPGDY